MPVNAISLTIGFPRESGAERRTILTPALARQLTDAGFTVIAEQGIGTGVCTSDAGDPDLLTALAESGVTAWSYEFVAEHGRFPLGRP